MTKLEFIKAMQDQLGNDFSSYRNQPCCPNDLCIHLLTADFKLMLHHALETDVRCKVFMRRAQRFSKELNETRAQLKDVQEQVETLKKHLEFRYESSSFDQDN